jgi:hypothetical protein
LARHDASLASALLAYANYGMLHQFLLFNVLSRCLSIVCIATEQKIVSEGLDVFGVHMPGFS